MKEHLISDGESLISVADLYGLSGWQGLYYADVNQRFRQSYPDPWNIQFGSTIAIPDSAGEQQYALVARCRFIEALQSDVMRLAAEQGVFLSGSSASKALASSQDTFGEIARPLADTTLRAVRLLKAAEHGCSRSNWLLADDALHRWPLTARHECAMLFSLVARSTQGVLWLVPAVAARGWCDAASPNFWAKPLLAIADRVAAVTPEPDLLLPVLRGALQVALANVTQQLAALRTGAMMELNHLARIQEKARD
jgi:hypothetical protein